jgi:RecJ-like exonuclease
MHKTFGPEKYGMQSCTECDGDGKFLNEFEEVEVCQRRGGFGFVKKAKGPDRNGIARLIINVEQKDHM